MEKEVSGLFGNLVGARASLYRRDFYTLVWTLERALQTLRRLYVEHERTWPGSSEEGPSVDRAAASVDVDSGIGWDG